MSDLLNEIREKIRAFEQLSVDQQLGRIDEAKSIRISIDQAQDQKVVLGIGDVRRYYQELVRPLIDRLQTQAAEELVPYQAPQLPPDTQAAQRSIEQAQLNLETIADLFPTQVNQPNYQSLKSDVDRLQGYLIGHKRLTDLSDEVNNLWARADKLEKGAQTSIAVDASKEALDLVQGAEDTTTWAQVDQDDLLLLEQQASEHYNEIRIKHEIPVTKASGDGLVEQVIQFKQMVEKDPDERTTYFEDYSSETARAMRVSEALPIAQDRLVFWWTDKIREYVTEADEKLDQYRPRQAREILEQARVLPGVNNPYLGVEMSQNDQVRLRQAEARIKPELEKLERAEEKARQAQAAAERDPRKAVTLHQEAQQTYPHLEGLEDLWDRIIDKAQAKIETLQQDLIRSIQREDWRFIKTQLNEFEQLLRLDNKLETRFRPAYHETMELYQSVASLLGFDGQPALELQQSLQILTNLKEQYRESHWSDWKKLQTRLAEIESRSQIENIEEETAQLTRGDVPLRNLESLHHDVENILSSAHNTIPRKDRQALQKIKNKLAAWKGYAQARDELAKIDELKAAVNQQDGIALLLEPPDLEVARRGLDDATQDTDAAKLAKRLGSELRRFQNADKEAATVLKKAQRLIEINANILDNLKQAIDLIQKQLNNVTSHRTELSEVLTTAKEMLATYIEGQLDILISAAVDSKYASLNTRQVQTLLREVDNYLQDYYTASQAEKLQTLTAGPLAIAQAHQLEIQASKNIIPWNKVQEAWQETRDLVSDDLSLWEYCRSRGQQAYKQTVFINVEMISDHTTAEKMLQDLLSHDSDLKNDWEVWFRHSARCFEASQTYLHHPKTTNDLQMGFDYLSKAQESLKRAQANISANAPEMVKVQTEASQRLKELNDWYTLGLAQKVILEILDQEESPPRYTNQAQRVIRAYAAEQKRLDTTSLSNHLFEVFWTDHINSFQDKLNQQFNQARVSTEKVDIGVAINVLDPQNWYNRTRLLSLISDEFKAISQATKTIINDRDANKFISRYRTSHPNQELSDQDVAYQQLHEVEDKLNEIENLKIAYRELQDHLPELTGKLDQLIASEESFQKWHDSLTKFTQAIQSAISQAEQGLLEPERFEVAKQILRQPYQNTLLPLPDPVPEQFRGHPTYRWMHKHLETMVEKRNSQQVLFDQITFCLKYEYVVSIVDLNNVHAESQIEQDLVETWKNKLAAKPRQYPLQDALNLMVGMETEMPDDDCGLQEQLVYHDIDDGHRRYESLSLIRLVIEGKVEQIRVLEKWLNQFSQPTLARKTQFVDWEKQKVDIITRRDSGPSGLMQAERLCLLVRDGKPDNNGLFDNDQWSLTRMTQEISQEAARQYLHQHLSQGPMNLSAPAKEVNRQRAEIEQTYQKQIAECTKMLENIKHRIGQHTPTWNAFRDAYNKIFAPRLFPPRNWSKTPDWAAIQEATATYCKICPEDREFKRMCEEVEKRTGLPLKCANL